MSAWYFCLEHHKVEGVDGCSAADRLGPYPTEEAAARALDTVAERNAEWDSDPGWNAAGFDNDSS